VGGVATKHRLTLFHVSMHGLGTRSVAQAVLQLQVASVVGADSNQGGTIYRVSDCSWLEKKVAWSTTPAIDPTPLSSIGPVTAGQVVAFDVTSAVTADGDYCFAIDSTTNDVVKYNAREAAAGQPQFIVTAQ
jgi:hypothetical protein